MVESSLVDLVYVLETVALVKEIVDRWILNDFKRIVSREKDRKAQTIQDQEGIKDGKREGKGLEANPVSNSDSSSGSSTSSTSSSLRYEMLSKSSRLYSLHLSGVQLQVVDAAVSYFDVINDRKFLFHETQQEQDTQRGDSSVLNLLWECFHFSFSIFHTYIYLFSICVRIYIPIYICMYVYVCM